MADRLMTIEVDPAAVVAALERLGPAAKGHCLAAAFITASAVKASAQATIPKDRPFTYANIAIETRRVGDGYVVMMNDKVKDPVPARRRPVGPETRRKAAPGQVKHVGVWLEFGTPSMRPRPFLFPAAGGQERPYLQRLAEALDQALSEVG